MNTKMKTQNTQPSDEVKKHNEDGERSGQQTDPKKEETDCSEVSKSGEESGEKPEIEGNSDLSGDPQGAANKEDPEEADADKSNEDEASEEEEKNTECVSKLEAEALSASLSSSRCLLKRNREDLESDSDNDDKEEEPDSKKSHKAVEEEKDGEKEDKAGEEDEAEEEETGEEGVTPVVVSASKLSSSELVASMSSSKSVLKRGFEQVEHCKEPEVKVKKSLITETSPLSKESPKSPQNEEVKRSPISVNSSQTKDRQSFNVKSPVIPASPLRPEVPLLESTRLNSPERKSHGQEGTINKSLTSPRESVRVIGAKDLEEDRKLERKRLNKMLLIFSDQKPV